MAGGRAKAWATGRLGMVEGGVETGDLRQRRRTLPQGLDRSEVMRLMERRQRHQAVERLDSVGIDPHGRRVLDATVHHPVADRDQVVLAAVLAQEVGQVGDSAVVAIPVTPFEIMTSKVLAMGLVVLVASGLSVAFVQGLLSVPIEGSIALFLAGTALHLFTTTLPRYPCALDAAVRPAAAADAGAGAGATADPLG